MPLQLKRAYLAASPADGRRVLVDRWWPRGLTKAAARVDEWRREFAPSLALCQWYAHDPAKWDGFRERYAAELEKHADAVREIARAARRETVTLLFGARDEARNNAVALREWLLRRKATAPGRRSPRKGRETPPRRARRGAARRRASRS